MIGIHSCTEMRNGWTINAMNTNVGSSLACEIVRADLCAQVTLKLQKCWLSCHNSVTMRRIHGGTSRLYLYVTKFRQNQGVFSELLFSSDPDNVIPRGVLRSSQLSMSDQVTYIDSGTGSGPDPFLLALDTTRTMRTFELLVTRKGSMINIHIRKMSRRNKIWSLSTGNSWSNYYYSHP